MSLCVALTREGVAPPGDAAKETAPLEAEIGGKARSLLRLARAGHRVPAAFAVAGELFRRLRAGGPALPPALRDAADIAKLDRARDALVAAPWPPGFLDELDQHLDRLGPRAPGARFSVRSSFAGEDSGDAIAAGVYESVVGVARGDVPAAIRRVLASGLSPGAVTYARGRGGVEREAAVLIHGYIGGPAGSAALDPGNGQGIIIEVNSGALVDAARAELERALHDLAAREGHAVEIEWVQGGAELVLLQLRPYVAPAPVRASTWAPAATLGPGAWRWDAAHNPLPLSPAQAGLVALVDARCRIGIRQRVARGYLFYAPDGPVPARALDPGAVGDQLAALVARFDDWQRAHTQPPALDEALAIFVELYESIYGLIQPAARRATRALDEFLRARLGGEAGAPPDLYAGVVSMAEERYARASDLRSAASGEARAALLDAYLARFGDEAPIWDIAAPTHREDPARLLSLPAAPARRRHTWPRRARRRGNGRRGRSRLTWRRPTEPRSRPCSRSRGARAPPARTTTGSTRACRPRCARRCSARASAWSPAACSRRWDDVFWLPFERVRAWAAGEPPGTREDLQAQVAAARADYARALQDPPELGGSGDEGRDSPPAAG